jgi:hypothetical protein
MVPLNIGRAQDSVRREMSDTRKAESFRFICSGSVTTSAVSSSKQAAAPSVDFTSSRIDLHQRNDLADRAIFPILL